MDVHSKAGLVYIFAVRHGERLDEVDRQKWRTIRTQSTLHDPPLTATGWDQAKRAGAEIAGVLRKDKSRITVYSSPTARTLSTAASIVKSLKLSSEATKVTPVYSMNCCAAAKDYGVAKAFPAGQPSLDGDVLRGVPVAWPPLGDPEQVDKSRAGFVSAIKELAAAHQDGDAIVLVTHREGIWELLRHVGLRNSRQTSGYCAVNLCCYDLQQSTLTQWDPQSQPRRVASLSGCPADRSSEQKATNDRVVADNGNHSQPQHRIGCHIGTSPQARSLEVSSVCQALSLEEVFATGSGSVMILSREAGRDAGVLLWETPGVHDAWKEGGPVPNGEIVELLSSPVASEGEEGDFVLIRRPSGIEGWTEVANVHLPLMNPLELQEKR